MTDPVSEFERRIAEFFGAPFGVAVDSCTHSIELCLRLSKSKVISCPKKTYLSVPMLANKLGINLHWYDYQWGSYYTVDQNIFDAAVLWQKDSYIPGTFMCISCQYQKHLSVGRLGVILTDNKEAAIQLKKLSYDGRLPNIPWRDQNVDCIGYHYYATPEIAQIALDKLDKAIATPPRIWTSSDYPDISQFKVFQNG